MVLIRIPLLLCLILELTVFLLVPPKCISTAILLNIKSKVYWWSIIMMILLVVWVDYIKCCVMTRFLFWSVTYISTENISIRGEFWEEKLCIHRHGNKSSKYTKVGSSEFIVIIQGKITIWWTYNIHVLDLFKGATWWL